MHIATAGNIGSGKTTLTKLLSKHYGWSPHFEDVDDNPYLDDFYNEMQRWSFNLQIYFLRSRFAQITEIRNSGRDVIQDRTIYEDAHIFAPNLHAMGLMTSRDFENYMNPVHAHGFLCSAARYAHLPEGLRTNAGRSDPKARTRL